MEHLKFHHNKTSLYTMEDIVRQAKKYNLDTCIERLKNEQGNFFAALAMPFKKDYCYTIKNLVAQKKNSL